jgi:DNA repair exonuclease SbcCD ATPase subunit
MQTDWAEADLRTVQFRRKRTFDAGATPGLDDFERPELKSVSDDLVGDLQSITEDKEAHENRIAELEAEVEKKAKRIETLEDELADARDISQAANKMADAIAGNTGITAPTEDDQQTLDEVDGEKEDREKSNAEIEHERNEFRKRARELEERLDDLATTKEDLEARVEALAAEKAAVVEERDELRAERDELATRVDELEAEVESMRSELGDERQKAEVLEQEADEGEVISDQADRIAFLEMALEQLQRRLSEGNREDGLGSVSTIDLLHEDPIEERVEAAIRESNCRREHAWDVLVVLADRGPIRTRDVEPLVDATGHNISSAIIELRKVNVVERDDDGRHEINRRYVEGVLETKVEREALAALKNRSRR